jgi:protein disulfide-isomerase
MSLTRFGLAACLLTIALAGPAAAAGEGWITDFEEAKRLAAEQEKLILADFTGSDWCGWCIKLKKEVWDTPEFKAWAKDQVILLELDYPKKTPQDPALKAQNQKLQAKYGIQGFPTILFMDAQGRALARSGYVRGGSAAWTGDADTKLAKVRAFLALEGKAERSADEEVELFLASLDMGVLSLAEARERKASLEGSLSPEQAAQVDEKLSALESKAIDDEIMKVVMAKKPQTEEAAAEVGATFWGWHQEGKKPLKPSRPASFYWVFILEHGYATGSLEIFKVGYAGVKSMMAGRSDPNAKTFLSKQEARLKELEAKAEGGGEAPAEGGEPGAEGR